MEFFGRFDADWSERVIFRQKYLTILLSILHNLTIPDGFNALPPVICSRYIPYLNVHVPLCVLT